MLFLVAYLRLCKRVPFRQRWKVKKRPQKHDLELYEAIWAFFLFGTLTALNKKPRFPGFFVGTVMLTYGVTRFGIEFLRHPATDIFYFGWPPAQYASLLLVVSGAWILWTRRNIPPVRLSIGARAG